MHAWSTRFGVFQLQHVDAGPLHDHHFFIFFAHIACWYGVRSILCWQIDAQHFFLLIIWAWRRLPTSNTQTEGVMLWGWREKKGISDSTTFTAYFLCLILLVILGFSIFSKLLVILAFHYTFLSFQYTFISIFLLFFCATHLFPSLITMFTPKMISNMW
jgi:hypothetical protein